MWSSRSHFPSRPTKTLPRRSAGCRCHRSRPILWCPRGSRRSRHPRANALAKSNQRCISAAHRAVIVVYRPASAAFPESNAICSPRCASQPGFVTVFVAGGSCRRSNCRRALARDRLASKTTKMPFMLGLLAPKKPVFRCAPWQSRKVLSCRATRCSRLANCPIYAPIMPTPKSHMRHPAWRGPKVLIFASAFALALIRQGDVRRTYVRRGEGPWRSPVLPKIRGTTSCSAKFFESSHRKCSLLLLPCLSWPLRLPDRLLLPLVKVPAGILPLSRRKSKYSGLLPTVPHSWQSDPVSTALRVMPPRPLSFARV
jgi:hypothetical protein